MTIEQSPQCIFCDYCSNSDYYYGNKREVWRRAKQMGWLKYKGKHFDTLECMGNYKKQIKAKDGNNAN